VTSGPADVGPCRRVRHLACCSPQIRAFLAARREFDPDRLLTNTFVEKLEALLAE
jgi:hypothetical protein